MKAFPQLSALSLAVLAAGSPTLWAAQMQIQLPDGALARAEQLDEIEVNGQAPGRYKAEAGGLKLPEPLRDAPRAVSVVPQGVIESQGALNLADALRNVAGLTLASGEGGFRGDNISLRGFAARTDIYLDGVRDNGQYSRDTFAIEQVEVLKGAAAMQFGRGASGGVVNSVSKRPFGSDRTRFDLVFGEHDLQRVVIDHNEHVNDAAALRVAALYHDADSFRDEVTLERSGIAPSLKLNLSEQTMLEASALYQKEEGVSDYGIPWNGVTNQPADVPVSNHYSLGRDSFANFDVLSGRVALSHGFDSGLELRNTVSFTDVERLHRRVRPGNVMTATPDASTTVTRDHQLTEATQNNLYNQTDFNWYVESGSISHNFAAGLEIGREDFRTRGLAGLVAPPPASLFDPQSVVIDIPLPTSFAGGELSTYRKTYADTVGIYLQDRIQFNDQWSVLAGLRHDQFEAEVVDFLSSTVLEREDDMTAYSLGTVYQPNDMYSWYANISNAYNPSAETFSLNAASAELDPEETRNIEAGVKITPFGDKLLIDVSLFSLDKFNARDVEPDGTGVQTLDGQERSRGIEIGVSGAITEHWHVFAGAAFMDPEIVDSNLVNSGVPIEGNTPANAPERSASLWTVYEFAQNWEIGGGAFHVSERFANDGNTREVPGYTRWDGYVGYRADDWRVALNVYNLTDRKYFDYAHSQFLTPGEPQTWRLSFSYAF
ncbi:TonB-dependent receptor [Pseudomarimonas arenosa]|uniref:TonB-dependent siderophore receptor n=1 Tax=Pseudomarimonas arenosa TaxID=2774145 RepID=A0AAW3ZKQ6_9GAMM|nr:TonB-dependent siderophore receptor [Pseudomarimonas arenosa]MBD8525647.1 TonB-dependent siderophore receptor [Pseudomarimonas arenosa]